MKSTDLPCKASHLFWILNLTLTKCAKKGSSPMPLYGPPSRSSSLSPVPRFPRCDLYLSRSTLSSGRGKAGAVPSVWNPSRRTGRKCACCSRSRCRIRRITPLRANLNFNAVAPLVRLFFWVENVSACVQAQHKGVGNSTMSRSELSLPIIQKDSAHSSGITLQVATSIAPLFQVHLKPSCACS